MLCRIILYTLLFTLGTNAFGQDYRVEIQAKGFFTQQMGFESKALNLTRGGYQAGGSAQLLYNVGAHIKLGVFYARAQMDRLHLDILKIPPYTSISSSSFNGTFQSYGISLKAGTSGYRTFSIFVTADLFAVQLSDKYSKEQLRTDKDLTITNSSYGAGAGFGISVKVSRRLSFVLFEARYNYYSAKLNYLSSKSFDGFTIESGLAYRFIKIR